MQERGGGNGKAFFFRLVGDAGIKTQKSRQNDDALPDTLSYVLTFLTFKDESKGREREENLGRWGKCNPKGGEGMCSLGKYCKLESRAAWVDRHCKY